MVLAGRWQVVERVKGGCWWRVFRRTLERDAADIAEEKPRRRYRLCCIPVVQRCPVGNCMVSRFSVVRAACAQQPELRGATPTFGRCCHGCLTAVANNDSLFLSLFLVAVLYVWVRMCVVFVVAVTGCGCL